MDGMHDVGGMDGFGTIDNEKNEPVFHHPWEGRAYAMNMLTGAWRKWNLDQTRYLTEKFTPRQYLALTYYERWMTGARLLRDRDRFVHCCGGAGGARSAGQSKAHAPD